MKRLVSRLAALLLVLGLAYPANAVHDNRSGRGGSIEASTPINVQFYRDDLSCTVPVRIKGSRLYAQLRAIGDCLGVGVEWDDSTGTARIFGHPEATRWGDLRLHPTMEDRFLELFDSDGSHIGRFYMGDQAPFIYEGRSYLPLRLLIEAFRVRVEWIPADKTPNGSTPQVHIFTDQPPMPYDIGAMGRYVYFVNGQFGIMDEPVGGWPVTPAAYVATVNAVNAANSIAAYAEATHGQALETVYEPEHGRLTIEHQNGRRTDWYPTHTVVWLRSEAEAQEFIGEMTSESAVDWLEKRTLETVGGLGVAWIGGVPWVIAAPIPLAYGYAEMRIAEEFRQEHLACLNTIRGMYDTWPNVPRWEGVFGFAYTASGVKCLTHYTRSTIAPDGSIR